MTVSLFSVMAILPLSATIIYPNTTLIKSAVKKIIIENLKSEHSTLFNQYTSINKLQYLITMLQIDENTKKTFKMDIEVANKSLGISCKINLVKLIINKWYVVKSSCSSTAEDLNAGFYFRNYDGELENVLNNGQFLYDTKLCYKSTIENALNIARTYTSDVFWVGDELKVDSIEKKGEIIIVGVFDQFSYDDQRAKPEERDDYIEYYKIGKCK